MRIDKSIQLAESYLRKGQRSEAIALCQKILSSKSHNDAIVYKILGEALEGEGAIEAARQAYIKAVKLQPNLVVVWALLGQLYADHGWLDEAIFHYQRALKLNPQWAQIHYHVGTLFYRLGKWDDAVTSFRHAIALNSNYYNAYFVLAVVLELQGKFEDAIKCYRHAMTLPDKNRVEAYNNLGALLLSLGDVDDAISVLEDAIALNPDWASLYNNLGRALYQKKPDDAIGAYQHAISLDPQMVLAHQNLGKAWQFQGLHSAAIECFQQIIKLNPEHIGAYTDLGFSLMALGKIPDAIVCFHRAIKLKPAFVESFCHDASLLVDTDELTLAKIACGKFLKALMKEEGRGKKEEGRGDELFITEKSAQDEESNSILNLAFDFDKICFYLGKTYLHLGNALVEYGGYIQAELYYQKALQIQPKIKEIYGNLAYCLAKQKRYNAAIVVYKMALAIQVESSKLYFELGQILELSQQWDGAINYYEKAFSLSAEHYPTSKVIYFKGDIKPPQDFYLSTWEWLINVNNTNNNYVNIIWEDVNKPSELHPEAEECGGLSCGPCLKKITELFKPINLGWNIYFCSQKDEISLPYPRTFVATIPEGRAWIVPQQNYWMICNAIAVITPDNYLLADLSRDYPGKLPVCQKNDPAKHRVFELDAFPPLETIDGNVAILSGLSGNVYFHWMVDILPRIELLRQGGFDLEKIDGFVVNSYQQPFQRETLGLLGIPENKIIESDRVPHIKAKQLICPSFPGDLGWPPPWAIHFLRREFFGKITLKSGYPERIYISRSKARFRKVFNETEVIEVLSHAGFVPIWLESLSFEEQIALFTQAKIIVSPHGSGLTNIIFCQKGTKVIELMSPHYIGHYYWGISHTLKLEHYYLTGDAFECYPLRELMYQNPLTEDIWVNLSSLEKMLEMIL
jgi:tetratricopeptide (TPR) repeat protein/capsular polysaccharide biosynthesis protein